MPEINIEVEVYCTICGEGLCNVSESGVTSGRHQPFIKVEPCKECMEKSYDEGFNKGYVEAERDNQILLR